MDIQTFIAGAAVALTAGAMTATVVWKMLGLVVAPLDSRLARIEVEIASLRETVRPMDDIERRTRIQLGEHMTACHTQVEWKISNAVKHHEERYHALPIETQTQVIRKAQP